MMGATVFDFVSRRRGVIGAALLAFAAVIGVSIWLGFAGHTAPTVVVQRPSGTSVHEPSGFDWGLWALVLTGLGTTLLAVVTGALALSTWQDVRASQQIAREAQDANELARQEQTRRPKLTLLRDEDRIYSEVEADRVGYVRLLVQNETGRRAARGTRVIVTQYVSWRNRIFTLGSPSLNWTRAPDAVEGALVIFAGSSRAFDLGYLVRGRIGPENDRVLHFDEPDNETLPMRWCLQLAVLGPAIPDRREWLVAGPCVVRLIVGADEADAHGYDVKVHWNSDAPTVEAALNSMEIDISPATK